MIFKSIQYEYIKTHIYIVNTLYIKEVSISQSTIISIRLRFSNTLYMYGSCTNLSDWIKWLLEILISQSP